MIDALTSRLASAVRGGRRPPTPRRATPAAQLVLYEFEGCPWCRRVREAVSDLDLDVLTRPCPKGGTRFRAEAKQHGRTFPILIDGERVLTDSAGIVEHLYREYGDGNVPARLTGSFGVTSSIASALRGGAGSRARASRAPDAPLGFTGHELDPRVRSVREVLCELELPHERRGDALLTDGDTRIDDPAEAVRYLESTYAS